MSEKVTLGVFQNKGDTGISLIKDIQDSFPRFVQNGKRYKSVLYIPDGTKIEIRGELIEETVRQPQETPPTVSKEPSPEESPPKRPKKAEKLPKTRQYKKGKKTMKEKILDNLQDGNPKHYTKIAEDIGYKPNSVSSVLTTMKKDGSVLYENKMFRIPGKPSSPTEGPPEPTVNKKLERRKELKQKMVKELEENPGSAPTYLAEAISTDKMKASNLADELIESGEIFEVKLKRGRMLFPKGIDPKPYLPVEPKVKILEALQHGPKNKSELGAATGIIYSILSNTINDLMESDEIHSAKVRTSGRHKEKTVYALKGVEIPIPETEPTKKDIEEERIDKFLNDIINIIKGREMTLAEIAEEYLGKSPDDSAEFNKFASDFGMAYNKGSIGKKTTESGHIYFLEGYEQRPDGSV